MECSKSQSESVSSCKPDTTIKSKVKNNINYFSVFNVRGLNPQTKPTKVPYIKDLLHDDNQLFIALTETWLQSHNDAELSINNYRLFRSDRVRSRTKGRCSGGVAVYMRYDFASSFQSVLQFSNGVVELLCVFSKKENMVIAVIYRQPDDFKRHRSLSSHFKEAMDKLTQVIEDVSKSMPNIILCGDFNLPHMSWCEASIASGSTTEEKNMLDILSTFSNENLMNQMITQGTHNSGNTLDLVFTNNSLMCHHYNCTPVHPSVSDHKLIKVSTLLNCSTDSISDKNEDRKSNCFSNFN